MTANPISFRFAFMPLIVFVLYLLGALHAKADQPQALEHLIANVSELSSHAIGAELTFSFSVLAHIDGREDKTTVEEEGKAVVGFDRLPYSRIKISYQPMISKWNKGAAPYLKSERSIMFDGKFWYDLTPREGNDDVKFAILSEQAPGMFQDPQGPQYFPLRLLSPSVLVFNKKPLLEIIASKSDIGRLYLSFARTSVEDGLLKIELPDAANPAEVCARETIWMDPNKGYAIIRRLREGNLCTSGQYETDYNVSRYDVIGKLHIPMAYTMKYRENGKLSMSSSIEVSGLRLLTQEELSTGNYFTPALEPGWRVRDERYDVEFEVGLDASSLMEKLKEGK